MQRIKDGIAENERRIRATRREIERQAIEAARAEIAANRAALDADARRETRWIIGLSAVAVLLFLFVAFGGR